MGQGSGHRVDERGELLNLRIILSWWIVNGGWLVVDFGLWTKQVFFVRIILVDCYCWMVDERSNLLKDHLGYSDDHGLHYEADDHHYNCQLREFKLHWIEEPTNPDDVLAHQAIAQVDDFQKFQFLVSLPLYLGSRP